MSKGEREKVKSLVFSVKDGWALHKHSEPYRLALECESLLREIEASEEREEISSGFCADQITDIKRLRAERDSLKAKLEGLENLLMDAETERDMARAYVKDLTADRDRLREENERLKPHLYALGMMALQSSVNTEVTTYLNEEGIWLTDQTVRLSNPQPAQEEDQDA